jgi:hypothetical protein
MYLFDKVLKISECGQFAVLHVWDVPHMVGRGYAETTVNAALLRSPGFSVGPRDKHNCGGDYSTVRVKDLKVTNPKWLITKESLLTKFELMQQEKGPPIEDPELLAMAKNLWTEKLAALRKQ